jgi:sugar phosphate isomerase/epimerase
MRVSLFPKCYIEDIVEGRMGLFDWIRMAPELGGDGLELYDGFLASFEPAYLREVRALAESLGLPIVLMCTSSDFTTTDHDVWQKSVDRQLDVMRASATLGVRYCRILSGQARPEIGVQQGVDLAVRGIEAVLPEAEKLDLSLAMENHYKDGYWQYPEFAMPPEIFYQIIDRIDHPRFGVQYDPSNAVVAGADPVAVLRRVLDRVVTMHASDRRMAEGHTLDELKQADGSFGYSPHLLHGEVGTGLIDYDTIFDLLAGRGYDGWVSIEDGMNGMDEMRRSVDYLRRQIARVTS